MAVTVIYVNTVVPATGGLALIQGQTIINLGDYVSPGTIPNVTPTTYDLLLSGDQQVSGSDHQLLSGDQQSGTDAMQVSGDARV